MDTVEGTPTTLGLCRMAQRENRAALDLLLLAIRPRLLARVRAAMSEILRARHDPEDVVQDILLLIAQAIGEVELRQKGAYYAWVFKIADNRLKEIERNERAEKRDVRRGEPIDSRVSDPERSVSSIVARNEEHARLLRIMATLSPRHCAVLRLRALEQLEYSEVAARLSTTVPNARLLYVRALQEMRACTEPGR